MSETAYTKIFTGNFILVTKITLLLEEQNIKFIIRDESESGRLAGFCAPIDGLQDLYVEETFVKKATKITESIQE